MKTKEQMIGTPREYTEEECREIFLQYIHGMIGYWNGNYGNVPKEYGTLERLNGLTHSILAAIDGCSAALPAFKLVPIPHEDDKQFSIDEGENYWPIGVDIAGGLHEEPTWRWKEGAAYEATDRAALVEAKDSAYHERNQVVAALAKLFPSGITKTNIPGWDDEWHNCVYIDLPTGQISYHYSNSEAHLFEGLPSYESEWDGHTKDDVHERLQALTRINEVLGE